MQNHKVAICMQITHNSVPVQSVEIFDISSDLVLRHTPLLLTFKFYHCSREKDNKGGGEVKGG